MTSRERVARWAFRLLDRSLPGLAARRAESLFFTPPRRISSPRVRDFLATGRRSTLRVRGGQVAAWRWGSGPPVYLVHGWAGRGGQLAAFGPPLVRAGFAVVTFDAPGHGASSGRRSSLLHFADTLAAAVDTFGPGEGVIAHSLGAAATALALGGELPVGRAVFVAPPADPVGWTRRFADRLGMSPAVLRLMQDRSERRLGFRWADLDVVRRAESLRTPLLVIHDRDDGEVPYSDGVAIAAAWPDARLLATTGLGHRRILRDPAVVEEAVAFVAGSTALSEQASLEQYLFDRDRRWKAPQAAAGGR